MNKKKILFVSTRSPFSNIFSGDRQRAKEIIGHFNKKNNLEVVYSDNFKGKKNLKVKHFFFKRNLLDRIFGLVNSLLKLEPLQLGFFYSKKVDNFLKLNHHRYHTIIFHLIRSAQYLPKNFHGKKILEMTDLMSKNYDQIVDSYSKFNLLKYIYILEKHFVKKYEINSLKNFDKIVLASKNDLKKTELKNYKKFVEIPNIVKVNNNIYNFKNSNKKILFIGNLNYLPNRKACKNFMEKILPEINKIYPDIEFHIIGEIKIQDKFFFEKVDRVHVHGPLKKLDNLIKGAICGICNVEIATGTQMKMLTYMSYGLPCISSYLSFKNTAFMKNKEILVYSNNLEFIKKIQILKENKNMSTKISYNSYSALKKKYNHSKVFNIYNKII